MTAQDVVPTSFEVLDEDRRSILRGDKPTVLLLEIPQLPHRFSVRPLDNDNPLVELRVIVTHPGCHGILMHARDSMTMASTATTPFVPKLAPPVDDERWLFNLGPGPLILREDEDEAPVLLELPSGAVQRIDPPQPRWLRVQAKDDLVDATRVWALQEPHTLLLADTDGHVRRMGIEGPSRCTIASGGGVGPPP